MIARLLCWLGVHAPLRGVDPAWSIYWCCTRCGTLVPGRLGVKGGKRR
jgi:hypothetical protein